MVNGTIAIQLGMLVGSLYNVFAFPGAVEDPYLEIPPELYRRFDVLRKFIIPITHAWLVLSEILNASTRFQKQGVKYFFSLSGMIL